MLKLFIESIKDFYDPTIFIIALTVGLYTLFVDYKYFKRFKYKKDASVTKALGVIYLILPFLLFIISRM